MEKKTFQAAARVSMGYEVFNQIADLLSSGVYKPGEKLPTEAEMCKQLQVSRPVLREATKALCYMGYLVSVQGGGVYVASPLQPAISGLKMKLALKRAQLMEIWELRYVLEVAIAGMAAERVTDEEIEKIWAAFNHYEQCVTGKAGEAQTIIATQDFHNAVADSAHNEVLMDMLENVSSLMEMSRKETIQVEGSSERAVEFHRCIAKAVTSRDVREAKKQMRLHLLDVKNDLMIAINMQSQTEE